MSRYIKKLRQRLEAVGTAQKRASSERYFPKGVRCVGATATDIKGIVDGFLGKHTKLLADDVLNVSEELLKHAVYSEEVLTAFGLVNPFVKRHYQEDLLLRFEYWLEHYASNWSHVDDLS